MMRVTGRQFFLLILLVIAAPMATANPKPDITVRSVEPAIAAPGDTVRVSVVVANDGTTQADFGPVTIETVNGITVTGTTSSLGEQFTLCGGCQRTGTFYLQVDDTATSGTYPVDIRLSTGSTGLIEKTEIEVDGRSSLVMTTENISIVPGETATLPFTLTNIGTDGADDVVLSAVTDGFAVSPSSLAISRLDAGGTLEDRFTLRADQEMEAGVANLRFTATYMEDNTEREIEFSVPVDVEQRAEIAIDDVAGDAIVVGQLSDVTVDIENLGPGQAERIAAELSCDTADVRNSRSFVGQLDDGESVPVVFTIVPEHDDVGCDLQVRYTDERQREVIERVDLVAAEQESMLPYLVLTAVVLVAGGYLWRKRRQDEVAEI